MTMLQIGVAQTASVPGDVVANVTNHVSALRHAAAQGARLVVFPELSLTGYELTRIAHEPELTLGPEDPRLDPLRAATTELDVIAVVGAPWKTGHRRVLAALAVDTEGEVHDYAKRRPFASEVDLFTPGDEPLVLDVADHSVAVGVCADLTDAHQVNEVRALGADAWLLGSLLSPDGYSADAERAAQAARVTGAPVILANHAAPTGGWDSAGRSGMWTPHGGGTWLDPTSAEPNPHVLVVSIGRRRRR